MTAREEILKRVRDALPIASSDVAASHARIARSYEVAGKLSAAERLHLFLDRLVDYDTEIYEVADEAGIAPAVADTLAKSGETQLLVPPALPAGWIPAGLNVQPDHDLTIPQVEAGQAVLTACEVAVASTGTIFLMHEGAQGRRILSLLPDHHICVVRRDQIVETVPEALRFVAAKSTLPVTTISGPSATADIEMQRVRGVHGPRRLTAILYS